MATVIVGIVVIAGLVGYTFYTNSSSLSSLSDQNGNLKQQLSGVSQQASNLGQQVSNLNQQESSMNQQVSNLNQQVSILQQKTIQVVTVVDTVELVETTTSATTSTVTSVSAVPEGTLVIVSDSYNNTTKTFTFQVQDTQNFTVYAQLHTLLDLGSSGQCWPSDSAEFFISPLYTWSPRQTISVTFNTALLSSGICSSGPGQGQFNAEFLTANNVQVSPTYDFQYQ
jgi:uncharacterized membrane protein YdfJ with MMPL/SSD domain